MGIREINLSVFRLLDIDFEDLELKKGSSTISYGDGANWYEFNPCEDPKYAWDIMTKNNMSIKPSGLGWVAEVTVGQDVLTEYNEKPEIAVMKLFISMSKH